MTKTMNKMVLCAISFIVSIHGANADSMFMRGAGTRSCAEFAQDYAKNTTFEGIYFAWAQGYMSAENEMFQEAGAHRYKDLGGDAKMQEFAIRNYCDQHPLALYQTAVDALFLALPMLDTLPAK